VTSLKKTPSREKEYHHNIILLKKKELKQNILADVKLEVYCVPRSRNGSLLQGF